MEHFLHMATVPMTDRVVIADDDEPTRVLLRAILSFAPTIEVVGEAADGAEAVRLVLEQRADAAILDVNMPGLDGGRAAEVIRAYRPRVKLLFHTAEVDGALRRRAERLEAPILLKGDPNAVISALQEVLGGPTEKIDPLVAVVLAALERQDGDGVLVVGPDGRVLFCDTTASELLGLPHGGGGPDGRAPGADADIVDAHGRPRRLDELALTRALSAQMPVEAEIRVPREGEILRYAVSAVPLFADDGALAGAAAYLTLATG